MTELEARDALTKKVEAATAAGKGLDVDRRGQYNEKVRSFAALRAWLRDRSPARAFIFNSDTFFGAGAIFGGFLLQVWTAADARGGCQLALPAAAGNRHR